MQYLLLSWINTYDGLTVSGGSGNDNDSSDFGFSSHGHSQGL